jgi:squalene synthase HpnC
MSTSAGALAAAYAACEHDASTHYENFPVASLLLPRPMRPHVAAVYAFARAADDFADEGTRPASERHALLDGWIHRLRHAAGSGQPGPPPQAGEPVNTPQIFVALGASIRAHDLPLSLFEDLISAFRQDITTARYASWSDLFNYCRRSANPIGRLVLRIGGHQDPALDTASDAVCTALQLTNFWQDLKIDFDRGRIYLPEEELRVHGARDEDLRAGRMTREWRQALAAATARTRSLFEAGLPVCDLPSVSTTGGISRRLRHELRATWLGGMRILERLERAGFDPIHARPKLGLRDVPWFTWRLIKWNVTRRSARHADRPGSTNTSGRAAARR